MDEKNPGEIIIVRRGGHGGDEGHHGGTWKIAYADFMTAMMAFFLVMWLVNATSEETKASIAAYFNPIKLTDEQPESKGVEENEVKVKVDETKEADKFYNNSHSKEPSLTEEAQMLDSPYGALETIILLERGEGVKQNEGGKDKKQQPGNAYHDPFSPQYWDEAAALEDEAEFDDGVLADRQQADVETTQDDLTKPYAAIASALSDKIGALMQQVMADQAQIERPNLRIVAQDEGVLIELADNKKYGMFDVGSAKPHAEIVTLLEGMAKIIAEQPGDVIISGHTDARPYKNSSHYDNWQLSSARAQMSYYMLVRGGLDEARILRVEGYADRDLKNRQDTYADENRRIAIFLKISPQSSLEKTEAMVPSTEASKAS